MSSDKPTGYSRAKAWRPFENRIHRERPGCDMVLGVGC